MHARRSAGSCETCPVKLFENDNFQGTVHTYNEGDIPVVHNQDTMSSTTVPSGCSATIFEHTFYGGWSVYLGPGRYTLSELNALGFQNDRTSSLKVRNGVRSVIQSVAAGLPP